MKEKINIRTVILLIVTLLIGIWRVLQATGRVPMSNFTPLGAMALFGGAYFVSKRNSYLLPLLTLLLSDIILMKTIYAKYSDGFLYQGWYVTYISFGLMVLVGSLLIKKVSIKNVVFASLSAGLIHFAITNFSVWLGGGMDMTTGLPYTKDLQGLIKCYTLAIPYFKNLVISNVFYAAILFGSFELAKTKFDSLKKPSLDLV